jgi:hypothetical protein
VIPADNPLTRAKVELGLELFFDARLSRDGARACATCHHPATGWATRPSSASSKRDPPTIANRALGTTQYRDGRVRTLEEQVLAALENPLELSITRADPDPTSATSVHFNITFSENVTNVDVQDFFLTATGISGSSITGVVGSGAARTVTVNTGVGNGAIRLDVVDNDSILNASGYPLGGTGAGNGNYNTGEIFTVRKNPTFADVPTSHLYYKDIEILYANGLTGGCNTSPLKFCPDKTMNRGEAAVFILRGNFGPGFVPGPVKHVFRDDWTKGTWAEPWAEAMLTKGLSAGCQTSPLKYCPWDQIPREQAVIFALRLKYGSSYAPPPATGTLFADLTDTSYYATPWVEQAYKDGLLPSCGTSGGKPKICPAALVSRGLGAYMIVRAKGLSMP